MGISRLGNGIAGYFRGERQEIDGLKRFDTSFRGFERESTRFLIIMEEIIIMGRGMLSFLQQINQQFGLLPEPSSAAPQTVTGQPPNLQGVYRFLPQTGQAREVGPAPNRPIQLPREQAA